VFSAGRPQSAHAQAVLVSSSIAPGSLLPALPATLQLSFSTDLVAGQSDVRVSGPGGASAIVGSPVQTPGHRSLAIRLRARGGGTYKVYWSSVSTADGNVVVGAFDFAVAYASAPGDLRARVGAHHATVLRLVTFFSALIRWLLLIAALVWAGGALLEASPEGSSAQAAIAREDAWLPAIDRQARRARALLPRLLIVLLVLSWLFAAAELWTAGRVSLAGSVTGLFSGRLGLVRLAALLVLLAALLTERTASRAARLARATAIGTDAVTRSARAGMVQAETTGSSYGGLVVLSLIFLFLLAAESHAAAVPAITLSSIVLAWIHDVGAAVWVGSLCYIAAIALPALDDLDLDRRAPLLLGLTRRHAVFAGAGLVILIATGLFAVQEQIGTRAGLTGNAYGGTLLLKMLLMVVLLVLTAYNLLVQRGYVEHVWGLRQRVETLAALDRLGSIFRANAVAGVLVVGATAALWTDTPPVTAALSPVAASTPAMPGGTWQSAGLRGVTVYRLLFQPGNRHTLWAATSAGVWVSTDDQKTWLRAGTALNKLAVYNLLPLDGGRDLLAAVADGHIYRTYDAGRHWGELVRPFGHHPLRALTQHGSVLVAAGDDGIYRSVDDGKHWHQVMAGGNDGIATVYWSSRGGEFLAGAERGSWRMYGGGASAASWQSLPGAPGAGGGVAAISWIDGTLSRLVAGAGSSAWIAPSVHGPWTHPAGVPGNVSVNALLPDHRLLGRMYMGTGGGGIYTTIDGGTSWAPLGLHMPSTIDNLVMRPGPTEILYAATTDGVFLLRLK
jgi:copper transport protein